MVCTALYADLQVLFSQVYFPGYLFELQYSAQSLHHGILLVMFHQVCQGVKLLSTSHIELEIRLSTTKHSHILVLNLPV